MLYFAYGSNLSTKRISDRLGKIKIIQNYILRGYKLTFDAGLHNGFANIVYTGNIKDSVPGVIYQISKRQLRQLDIHEGVWNKCYERFYLTIDGLSEDVQVYISVNEKYRTSEYPRLYYIEYLLIGYKEHGIPIPQQVLDLVNKIIQYKYSTL